MSEEKNDVSAKIMEENAHENVTHVETMEVIRDNGLEDIYLELVEKLAGEDRSAVTRFHEAGMLLLDLSNTRSTREMRAAISAFERTKKLNRRVLLAAMKFAREFTPQQVSQVSDLYNEDLDYRVNQSHLQRVMADFIVSTEERIAYLTRAVNEGLSADKLFKIIQSEYHRTGGTGRQHEAVTGKEQLLVQIQELCGRVLSKAENVWENRENPAMQLLQQDLGEVTEVTRSEVRRALDVLEQVRAMCDRLMPQLRLTYENYVDVILRNNPSASSSPNVTDPGNVRRIMPDQIPDDEDEDEDDENNDMYHGV